MQHGLLHAHKVTCLLLLVNGLRSFLSAATETARTTHGRLLALAQQTPTSEACRQKDFSFSAPFLPSHPPANVLFRHAASQRLPQVWPTFKRSILKATWCWSAEKVTNSKLVSLRGRHAANGLCRQKLRVSSAMLSRSSRVFKAMLSTKSREGTQLQANGAIEISLLEDSAAAMSMVCNLLHLQFDNVRTALSISELLQWPRW